VLYAYKSAMISLRYFPEIWFDCANFLARNERLDDCITLLKQGVQINDTRYYKLTSLLLSFTLAENLESKHEEFEIISVIFDELLEKLELKYKQQNEKYDQERMELMKVLKETLLMEDDNEDEGEKRERERELAKEHEKEVDLRVEQQRKISNLELKKMTTLVWIIYMRLSRRSQSIRAARLVFSRARKSDMVTSHVFTASALMEYYVNKDPTVAGKIFELGMKSFPLAEDPESTEYIIRYLDFLMCLNDDNNTRALFERSLAVIPKERSKPIWDKYNDYETQYGDLSNLYRIEKRYNEQFPVGTDY
jgi:cleavage stimulation factor subunit 3